MTRPATEWACCSRSSATGPGADQWRDRAENRRRDNVWAERLSTIPHGTTIGGDPVRILGAGLSTHATLSRSLNQSEPWHLHTERDQYLVRPSLCRDRKRPWSRNDGADIPAPRLAAGEAQRAPGLDIISSISVGARASGETVLIAEDDPSVRNYVVEALRELDYGVIEVDDGTAALTKLSEPDLWIDLLLTDVVMPGINGRELADQARRSPATHESPFHDRVLAGRNRAPGPARPGYRVD